MIKEAIVKIVGKEDLTYNEAYDVINEIMNGETVQHRMRPFWQRFLPRALRRRLPMKSPAAPLRCVTTH